MGSEVITKRGSYIGISGRKVVGNLEGSELGESLGSYFGTQSGYSADMSGGHEGEKLRFLHLEIHW